MSSLLDPVRFDGWGDTPFARIGQHPYYRHDIHERGAHVVSWVRRGSAAIALGEPLGDPENLEGTLLEFQARRRAEGLGTIFLPLRPRSREIFARNGYRTLFLGRSGQIDLGSFDLRGQRFKSLRHSRNRGQRQGYRVAVAPFQELDSDELRTVSDLWLSTKRLPELRFGMGWFDQDHLKHARVASLRNRFGRLEAFVSLIEGYKHGESSLDLMRVRTDAGPGTMDYLLLTVIDRLQLEGIRTLDLGLAPFCGWEDTRRGLFLRRLLRPVYNAEGLYSFKNKFRPRWEARFLAFDSCRVFPSLLTGFFSE